MSQPVKTAGKMNSNPTVKAVNQPVPLSRNLGKLMEPLFLVLIVVGLGISGYLTWTHYTDTPILCTADHSCDTVNRSAYAYFPPNNKGIPVAVLGLAGYLVLLVVAGLRYRRFQTGNRVSGFDLALFIVTIGGVIFSAYLTAMEIWVIHAICWWCVSSALVMTALLAISVIRIWNSEPV